MPQILTCPCGKRLRVPDGATGVARCPACQAQIPIPAVKLAAPPPVAEAPKPPPPKPAPPPPPAPPAKKAFSLDEAVRSADKSTRARPAPPPPPSDRRPKSGDADDRPRRPKPEDEPDDRPRRKPPADDAGDEDAAPARTTNPLPLLLGGCAVFLLFGCLGGVAAYYLYPRKTDTAPTKQAGDGTDRPGGGVTAAPKEFKGHEDMVHALAFAPDGTLLVSASRDKTLRVWDVADGDQRAVVPHPAGPVWNAAWTADGRVVTTSGDGKAAGSLTWIEPATGAVARTTEADKKNAGPVRALAVSPDGRKLAWLNGPKIEVISARVNDPPTPLGTYGFNVYDTLHAAFTPDGRKVLLTSNSGTQVWTWETPGANNKAAIRGAKYTTQDTTGVRVAGGGLYAVSTTRGVISILDPTTLDLVENVRDLPSSGAFGVAASPDGKHIASAMETGVRVFDPKTRQEVGRFAAPAGTKFQATCVAYSPDGTKVAAGGGFTVFDNPRNFSIYMWDVAAMSPAPAKK